MLRDLVRKCAEWTKEWTVIYNFIGLFVCITILFTPCWHRSNNINQTRATTEYHFIADQSAFFFSFWFINWSIKSIKCSAHSPRGPALMSCFEQPMNQIPKIFNLLSYKTLEIIKYSHFWGGTTYIFVLMISRQSFS